MFNPSTYSALCTQESETIRRVIQFVRTYFSDERFDASHDFEHVSRVTSSAIQILLAEEEKHGGRYNAFIVILGALLHDVSDRKYVRDDGTEDVKEVDKVLRSFDVSAEIASRLQTLVDGVSYSSEIRDPDRVQFLIQQIPELAIVQDADRLDALGAIGIGRCFTFGGARSVRSLDDSIDHFEEKLLKLEKMMKTDTGKVMAKERTDRIRQFMTWWKTESALVSL